MIFEYKYYSPEELKNSKRFTAYLNYLQNINSHIEERTLLKYLQDISASSCFISLKTNKLFDRAKLTSLLRNAWFTELQLSLSAKHPEFIPYSNHWACSQQYYSIYLSLRALFVAMNCNVSHTHAANLKEVSGQINRRPSLYPDLFSVTCSGDPKNNSIIYNNLPINTSISTVSALAKTPDFWNSYCMFLRTTRDRQINEKRITKPFDKIKKLPKSKRSELVSSIPDTTIFDCLFRLRVMANYSDIEPFLSAIDDDNSANKFYNSIRVINNAIMQILELQISKYITLNIFESIVNDFCKPFEKHMPPVLNRLNVLKAICTT